MTNAARIGFPRNRMMYVTFGGAEEDMFPAGEAAVGTYVVANAVPGMHPLVQKIKDTVYGANKGNMSDPNRVGTVYYNRGLGAAMMWVEGMRNAQRMHKKVGKAVTGAEFRDCYEAINLTEARLSELGVPGMLAPFAFSCANHEGSGKFALMQWDGKKFNIVRPFTISLDTPFIRKILEESAAKFADENKIVPKKC